MRPPFWKVFWYQILPPGSIAFSNCSAWNSKLHFHVLLALILELYHSFKFIPPRLNSPPNFELDKSPTSFFFHIDPCSPHPFEFRLILPPLQYSLLGIITKLNTPPHQNAHMSISLRSKFLKYVFSSVKIFKTHFREASLLVISRHKITIHSPRLHLTKSHH